MSTSSNNASADMNSALGSLPSGSVVTAVATKLLDYFTSGAIEPGTRLPSERLLAATLHVGRSAVREALAALEILGIVDVRPGSGTYLRGSSSELLPQTLSWGMMLGEPRTLELIEVRGQLEVFAVQLAAERISDEELDLLEINLVTMKANLHNLEEFIEADVQFHLQIAKSAGNIVLLDLLQSIRSLLRIWVERRLQEEGEALLAYEEHSGVYEALLKHDPDAASVAMGYHMTTAGKRLAQSISRSSI